MGDLPLRRQILCLLALMIAALALGGCDRCGGFEKIVWPSVPKTCQGDAALK